MKSIIKFLIKITAGHLYKSHKGSNALDLYDQTVIFAPFRCKVVKTYDTGGTNSVWYQSVEKVLTPLGWYYVTFRCAHMDTSKFKQLGIVIGKVFEQFDACYYAGNGGTKDKHCHIEFGLGKMKGSGWLNTGYTAFNLPVKKIDTEFGSRPVYECVFLDQGVKVIQCDDYQNSYTWKYLEDEKKMEFKNGYQELAYLKQKIHLYKQSGKEELALIALPWGQVQDITKFVLPGYKIICITNANYFGMQTDNGYLGRCQGYGADARTIGKGETGFTGDDKPFMDLVVLKDGTVKAGDFNSWDYPIEEVLIGTSPAGVQLLNGKDVNKYSPACGYAKVTTPNTQTLLIKNSDGTFSLATVEGKLSLLQCRDFVKQYGCTEMSGQDSGGSSQMVVNGEKMHYTTGRKIPVCLAIVEKIEDEPEEPVTPPTDDKDLKINELIQEVAKLNKTVEEANALVDSVNKQLVDEIKQNELLNEKIERAKKDLA
ncbi:hypothetical protein [Anaerorhabdus sp.]|uniref:hypothetical protein n=1 Tax=Anaerorhabdus sp. TaxID=1872524 RepID=UPI002FC7B7BB